MAPSYCVVAVSVVNLPVLAVVAPTVPLNGPLSGPLCVPIIVAPVLPIVPAETVSAIISL